MKNNIAAIRKARGLSQADLAEAMGIHWTNLSKIERNKSEPNMDRYQQIAELLGVDLPDLFADMDPAAPAPKSNRQDPIGGVEFAGTAQAGVFVDVDLYTHESRKRVMIAPDPRYLKAKQYAWLIRGDSMNRAGMHEGMFALGVDYIQFADHYRPVVDGDIVLVERLRFDGQERELTVKRYREMPEGVVHLMPESSNPRHKAIEVPKGKAAESEQIRILAFVSGAYSLFGMNAYDLEEGQMISIG